LRDYDVGMRVFGPYGGFNGHWVVSLVVLAVVLALIIAAVIVAVRLIGKRPIGIPPGWGGSSSWRSAGPHHALAELDLRYARGEIDRNDYLQRRADLLGQPYASGSVPPSAPGGGPGAAPKP
jgi:uncharacterized membrane protein